MEQPKLKQDLAEDEEMKLYFALSRAPITEIKKTLVSGEIT